MTGSRQSLIAAIASTVCAGTWLINCVMDVTLHIPGVLGRDALLTTAWTLSAVCWWVRWSRRRVTGL